eukprot:g5773.t1
MPLDKDVLTTGEDRRIPVAELYRFMKEHQIPMDGITSGQTRVLIVDSDAEIVDALERVLNEQTNYEVQTATTGFQAGLECERFRPHVVLMDVHLTDTDASNITNMIRSSSTMQMTRIIAMSGKLTDGQAQGLRQSGYDSFLKKPFQVRQVVDSIENVTSLAA